MLALTSLPAYSWNVQLEWNRGELAEGLECYRSQRFFDAHEHWESVWLRSQEPEKRFLQAVIQVAAAFHHLERHNRIGAASLLRRALAKLSGYPTAFGGIEVESLREDIVAWLQTIEAASDRAPREYPRISTINVRPG